MAESSERVAVHLDIVDNAGRALSGATGALRHLDGEWAHITLPTVPALPGLRWGALVRFWVEEGTTAYEITGTVAARDHIGLSPVAVTDLDEGVGEREIWVRLRDSQQREQRRALPRRRQRFAVEYRALEATGEAPVTSSEDDDQWFCGWCVDLGVGGMRLRGHGIPAGIKRVEVRFALPPQSAKETRAKGQVMQLTGQALRVSSVRRWQDVSELAVKFTRLAPQQAQAFARFLNEE